MSEKSALVVGVGAGLGASLCRALDRDGYRVWGLGRSLEPEGELAAAIRAAAPGFTPVQGDGCDERGMATIVSEIEAGPAPLELLIFNAAHLHIGPLAELKPAEFEEVWRSGCLAAMVAAQACLAPMAARGRGTVLFVGATASLRGGADFPAFASAKFALRGLAQSLARAYWPRGVHVAHVVLDGRIGSDDGQLSPASLADAMLWLVGQPKAAWTHELDLRPAAERF